MSLSGIPFLFGLLPIFLFLFYISKPKFRVLELLAFSILFYAINDAQCVVVFLAVIIINYVIALFFDKVSRKGAKALLVTGIAGNVGVLFYYKYLGFFYDILGLPHYIQPTSMMAGVSFTVFAMISFLADVYHKKTVLGENHEDFFCYALMFPKVLSGPIVRYADCAAGFGFQRITAEDIGIGAKKYMKGYIKKVLIADNLSLLLNEINAAADVHRDATVVTLWIGSVAFSLQLLFDFSGYSDMAIGLGRMLGYRFKENFDHPYICRSFTDFWRRWHISLSEWFRDYIYIPLGGSRQSAFRNVLNLLVVWLITGIWHGAGLHFIVWGLVFFVMLLLERYVVRVRRLKSVPALLWRIFTLFIINFNWVIFSRDTLTDGVQYCLGMFGYFGNTFASLTDLHFVREYGIFLLLGIVLSLPVTELVQKKSENSVLARSIICTAAPFVYGLLFLWSLSFALLGYHNPFMYQQF